MPPQNVWGDVGVDESTYNTTYASLLPTETTCESFLPTETTSTDLTAVVKEPHVPPQMKLTLPPQKASDVPDPTTFTFNPVYPVYPQIPDCDCSDEGNLATFYYGKIHPWYRTHLPTSSAYYRVSGPKREWPSSRGMDPNQAELVTHVKDEESMNNDLCLYAFKVNNCTLAAIFSRLKLTLPVVTLNGEVVSFDLPFDEEAYDLCELYLFATSRNYIAREIAEQWYNKMKTLVNTQMDRSDYEYASVICTNLLATKSCQSVEDALKQTEASVNKMMQHKQKYIELANSVLALITCTLSIYPPGFRSRVLQRLVHVVNTTYYRVQTYKSTPKVVDAAIEVEAKNDIFEAELAELRAKRNELHPIPYTGQLVCSWCNATETNGALFSKAQKKLKDKCKCTECTKEYMQLVEQHQSKRKKQKLNEA